MSRQNKVNPGMYTQRGRLTQDDAARELAKQRNVGSPNTWQPVQRDQKPPMIEQPQEETTDDDQDLAEAAPTAVEKEPARAKAARPATAKAAKPASRSAQPQSRRPAKTAARTKSAPRKSAPRKSGVANRATTATKRGKAKKAAPARSGKAKSARAGKAKTAKRRKS
jgi:hypothetical protein